MSKELQTEPCIVEVKRQSEDYFGFHVVFESKLNVYLISNVRKNSKIEKNGIRNGTILSYLVNNTNQILHDDSLNAASDVDDFLKDLKDVQVFYHVVKDEKLARSIEDDLVTHAKSGKLKHCYNFFGLERYYARGKRGDSGRGFRQVMRGNLPVFGRTRIDLAGLS